MHIKKAENISLITQYLLTDFFPFDEESVKAKNIY